MPLENNPDTSRIEEQPGTPEWINKWEASISLHKSNLPSIEQVRAMTTAAFDAAATSQPETHVTINTPDVFASEPLPVEIIDFRQLSEKELSARVEEFRKALLNDEEIKQFIAQPSLPEGATRQDYDLAA